MCSEIAYTFYRLIIRTLWLIGSKVFLGESLMCKNIHDLHVRSKHFDYYTFEFAHILVVEMIDVKYTLTCNL